MSGRDSISIHAPHTGRDGTPAAAAQQGEPISIHAPHTGRDGELYVCNYMMFKFQSTRPIRGATSPGPCNTRRYCDFNPRAPYGARLIGPKNQRSIPWEFQSTRPIRGATVSPDQYDGDSTISIHAPHTGRDLRSWGTSMISTIFQSTRPIRGATCSIDWRCADAWISIHAPHTGRDRRGVCAVQGPSGISIHAPHTGRDATPQRTLRLSLLFQSTRPIRGATVCHIAPVTAG